MQIASLQDMLGYVAKDHGPVAKNDSRSEWPPRINRFKVKTAEHVTGSGMGDL